MMDRGVLGVLWILKGVFELILIGLFAAWFGLFGGIALLSGDRDGMIIGGFFVVTSLIIVAIFVVLTIPSIIIGWGIRSGSSWGWVGGLVLAGFNLFHMPIGTILSILTFATLLDSRNRTPGSL